MSASEKLKALGKAVDEMKITESDRLWLDLQPELISLRAALPQIVAVVESSERSIYVYDRIEVLGLPSRGKLNKIRAEALTALAALEEALS
jgi:hypothetical protein